mgnify:CR=1 FL=1
MKERILLRLIPDLCFIAFSASIACIPLYYSKGLSTYIQNITSVTLVVFISFMFGFLISGAYANRYGSLKQKLKGPVLGILIGTLVSLIITLFLNFNLVFSYISNSNDLIFEEMVKVLTTTSFAFIALISARLWIHIYVRNNSGNIKKDNIYRNQKNVLIIGGGGYIGSSLVEQLLQLNFNVKVLDILFFGEEPIKKFIDHPSFELIKADFRKVDDLVMAMQDCHSLVHLGGLVGDPACAVDESLTTEVNLTSTKIIGQIAKANGVKRLIFASSCSVYGAQDSLLDENSKISPLSLYAQTKAASENVLQDLNSEDFSVVILRFATVFGLSGRTRFDLVVNLLTAKACSEKNMTVFGAQQTRPFIHVFDAARSIVMSLKAKKEDVQNEVFNVGGNNLNYTLLEVANLIKLNIKDANLNIEEANLDARNYNVSFEKIKHKLGFEPKFSLEEGILQVVERFKEKDNDFDYSSPLYSNFMHMSENGRDLLGSLEYVGWEKELLEAQN